MPGARGAHAGVAGPRDLGGRSGVAPEHHEARRQTDGRDAREVPHVAVLVEALDHREGVLLRERLEVRALREEGRHERHVGRLDERVEVLAGLAPREGVLLALVAGGERLQRRIAGEDRLGPRGARQEETEEERAKLHESGPIARRSLSRTPGRRSDLTRTGVAGILWP